MSNTLFPETTASSTPKEPPLWFRRLVILSTIAPEPVEVRNIEFQRGLNLICTREPAQGSGEALGHDVGKTLLTRLLRYVVGESKFAEDRTRKAIQRAFPDSWVAAEVTVGGKEWSILRPLGAPNVSLSRAAMVSEWQELLLIPPFENEFTLFLQAISDSVLESISSPNLTHKQRPVNWMDVLAWIARDQKCRYAHPLVWRHKDAESENDPLNVEDASTVLRCVSGLMSGAESQLFETHDGLLRERRNKERERDSLRRAIDAEDGLIGTDLHELLGSNTVDVVELAPEFIRTQITSLQSLRESERQQRDVSSLQVAYEQALQAKTELGTEIRLTTGRIKVVQAQRDARNGQPDTDPNSDWFSSLCTLSRTECPAKMRIDSEKIPDPHRNREIAQLEEELEEVSSRLDELRSQVAEREVSVNTSRQALQTARVELENIVSGINDNISQLNTMIRRIERQLDRQSTLETTERRINDLVGDINQSSEEQRTLRTSLDGTRDWLASRFQSICHLLLGGDRNFVVNIESKAVSLNVVGADAAPGEATSTATLVLSLDLAAMRSAMDGYGHHPRLAILDSPREADLEIGIFHRLIKLLSEWHKSNNGIDFQIIMTTTTHPDLNTLPAGTIRQELARRPLTDLLFRREL